MSQGVISSLFFIRIVNGFMNFTSPGQVRNCPKLKYPAPLFEGVFLVPWTISQCCNSNPTNNIFHNGATLNRGAGISISLYFTCSKQFWLQEMFFFSTVSTSFVTDCILFFFLALTIHQNM